MAVLSPSANNMCWIGFDINKRFNLIDKDNRINNMDLFEYPDDYKPEKYLTTEEMEDIHDYLKNHPLFMKELPQDIQSNEHLVALQEILAD